MIYGIGTDIVSTERISHILSRYKLAFIRRILTKKEIETLDCKINDINTVYYCAKRFSAKEALAKALGIGIGSVVGFQDLAVRNDKAGKPYFQMSRRLSVYLTKNHIHKIHLSLSDEKHYALAFVILES